VGDFILLIGIEYEYHLGPVFSVSDSTDKFNKLIITPNFVPSKLSETQIQVGQTRIYPSEPIAQNIEDDLVFFPFAPQ